MDQEEIDAFDATLPPCPECGSRVGLELATCTDQDCCGQQDEIACSNGKCLWATYGIEDFAGSDPR